MAKTLDNFGYDGSRGDLLYPTCKQCKAERVSKYKKSMTEEQLAKEKERHRAAMKKYNAGHRDLMLARLKEYWQKNKDKIRIKQKQWRELNRDRVISYVENYRFRKVNAPGHYEAKDVSQIYKKQAGLCYYCKEPMSKHTIDHKVPLTRGGSNWPRNLCLACKSCNSTKGAKTHTEFIKTAEVYS